VLGGLPGASGAAAALALAALALAPLQCAPRRGPGPGDATRDGAGGAAAEGAGEDSAPEALWALAERLGADGATDARRRTLEYLVERYPSSRFSRKAALALREPGPARGPQEAGGAAVPASAATGTGGAAVPAEADP
jgi:hypothetical protein